MIIFSGNFFSKIHFFHLINKPLESTKELIKTLESDVGIPTSQLIDSKKGNTTKYSQGSWIHPDLAVQLAQWISPKFALQVSKWIRELAVTGSVRIGMEKTDNKILELQNALTEQIIENKKIKKIIKMFCINVSITNFTKELLFT